VILVDTGPLVALADADDTEQQIASAAQRGVLVDRLANSLVDSFELAGEMLDRHDIHPPADDKKLQSSGFNGTLTKKPGD